VAATNKCLARNNKSFVRAYATNQRGGSDPLNQTNQPRETVKMKTSFVIAAAILVAGLLPAYAQEKSLDEIDKRSERLHFAEGLSRETFDRIIISGTKTQIGFFHSLNPDCTLTGETIVRVTKEPEHGKIDIATINSFAHFKKDNIRFKCNEHKVKGPAVFYKSEDKYVGDDAVDFLVIFPKGFAWDLHVNLKVK
jgi:hypothetical protein